MAGLMLDFNMWINLWAIGAIDNIAPSSQMGLLEQVRTDLLQRGLMAQCTRLSIDKLKISRHSSSPSMFGITRTSMLLHR
jgi:hypothetical protein